MRDRLLLIPVVVLVALGLAALAQPQPESAAAASCPGADKGPRKISSKTAAKVVACLVNEKRSKHGKRKLELRRNLVRAAKGHVKHMQRSDCFDHICPGEPDLSGRYERADYLPCGCSWGAAENIAWGPGRKGSPRKIVKSWMRSPAHRQNILGPYEHIGVGVRWGSPQRRSSKAGTYTLDFGYKR